MKELLAIGVAAVLTACASPGDANRPDSTEGDSVVTYHDRNHDGIVDYEFHALGCCDRDWALVDTDFDQVYDLKRVWSYSLIESPVDLLVPAGVPISEEPVFPGLDLAPASLRQWPN